MTTTTIYDPERSRAEPARAPNLVPQRIQEAPLPLYAGSPGFGAAIVAHDFQSVGLTKWPGAFPSDTIQLCLNLAGCGRIHHAGRSLELESRSAGFYGPGKSGCEAWRDPDQRHQFIVIQFSRSFLHERLSGFDGALHPLIERLVRAGTRLGGLSESHRLTTSQEQRTARLLRPPVPQGARPLWYQSQVLELMAEFFFERQGETELLCDRQKRLARERVDRVIAVLRGRLAQPPNLTGLSREVGCSPFYLSRTFSQEMGMTIPQYLRKLRMERAGELLRGGQYNVTEAALEVGYSSLSHFSQAFCQTMGCCPVLYPAKTSLPQV